MNKLNRNKKRFVLICTDLLMLFVAVLIAMLFMMGFASISLSQIMISYLVVIIVYLVSASRFKIFSVLNRFTDYRVLLYLVISLIISYSLLVLSTVEKIIVIVFCYFLSCFLLCL